MHYTRWNLQPAHAKQIGVFSCVLVKALVAALSATCDATGGKQQESIDAAVLHSRSACRPWMQLSWQYTRPLMLACKHLSCCLSEAGAIPQCWPASNGALGTSPSMFIPDI
jgi:hypothetical protein